MGRRGSLALELLLLLPVLLFLALGVVELCLLMSARERVVAACREGGRGAARGGDEDDVREAVRRHLGHGELGEAAEVHAELRDDDGRLKRCGEPVEVCVEVSARAATPDLLRLLGCSIKDETIVARTAMRKE